MERMRHDGRALAFAVVEMPTDALLGACDLRLPLPGVGEVGYLLAPAARGRGVMSRGLRLVVAWAFRELRLRRGPAVASPGDARPARAPGRVRLPPAGALR